MLAGIESRPAPSPRMERFKEMGSKTKTRWKLLHLIRVAPNTNIPNFFIHLISRLYRIHFAAA